jgi:uncharacterized membrane protein (UPF0127 family)
MKAHFLGDYLRSPQGAWAVRNQTNGTLLATSILPAFDRKTRNRGLLGRSALPVGAAMVLVPCRGVHTWFMRFPIDVIFVSRSGRVLRVRRAVAPFHLALGLFAFAAIELAAGSASATNVDDMLVICQTDAKPSTDKPSVILL